MLGEGLVLTGRVEKIAVMPHEKRRGVLRNVAPNHHFNFGRI